MKSNLTIKKNITTVLFSCGAINKLDLISLIEPYSLSPSRYVHNLSQNEIIDYNKKFNNYKLTSKKIKEYKQLYTIKEANNIIDEHKLIIAKTLLFLLEKKKVKEFEIEKKVNGTSLQVDLYAKLDDGQELYIESDTGTERETELRNKILNYNSFISENRLMIFITKTKLNYDILTKLTQDQGHYRIILDTNNKALEFANTFDTKLEINPININSINNIDQIKPNIKFTNKEIQKLITSI